MQSNAKLVIIVQALFAMCVWMTKIAGLQNLHLGFGVIFISIVMLILGAEDFKPQAN